MSIENDPLVDPFTALSDAEIELLDNFLLDRINNEENTANRNEGIISISELDGFFTAIISGPDVIQPSKWLPIVWGEFEPDWESEENFMAVISLLVRHMNTIADTLIERPFDFKPLFLERNIGNKTYTIVDDWCEGYLLGVSLLSDQWQSSGDEMAKWLAPINAFTQATNWQGHNYSKKELEVAQQTISESARKIHAYWLAKRSGVSPKSSPSVHQAPRVGRNDPCPCGSGKIYKKCCLH
jgi:uncharacterized protein